MNGEVRVVLLRSYLLSELCGIYGMSKPTFRKKLAAIADELGKRSGNKYSDRQVEIIFNKILLPAAIQLENFPNA